MAIIGVLLCALLIVGEVEVITYHLPLVHIPSAYTDDLEHLLYHPLGV